MAIEYDCPECGARLRVPDEAAGGKGRCPRCGAVSDVPMRSPNAELADFPADGIGTGSGQEDAPRPGGGDASWYSDTAIAEHPAYSAAETVTGSDAAASDIGGSIPTNIEGIARHATNVWKEHLGLLLGATLIVALINGLLQSLPRRLVAAGARSAPVVLLTLLASFVEIGLGAGMWLIALKLVRRQPAGLDDLAEGFGRVLPLIVGLLLLSLVLGVGYVLLVVPGIILSLRLWPYPWLIVDRRCGVLDAFSTAWEMTSGHWLLPVLVFLMAFGAVLLGLLACGIGVLLAAPYVLLLWATAYVALYDEWARRS